MANLRNIQAEIDAVNAEIKGLGSKEERLEAALEGNGSYLGTTDHGELRSFHERLTKEKEQLRMNGEQLREKQLVILRQQQTAAHSSQKLGAASGGSSQTSPRSTGRACVSSAADSVKEGGAGSSARSSSAADAGALASQAAVGEDTTDSVADEDENEISFSIKTLTGKQHTIRAFPSETVLDVKKKVQDTQGIPCEQQRIIYAGQQTSDDRTLRDCNIRNGSVAHLVLSLRKPVILLYPPAPVDITVAVELSPLWSFSSLYPKLQPRNLKQLAADYEAGSQANVAGGQQCKWNVHASPGGSLKDLSTGREYPYLFWEADSSDGRVTRSFGLDGSRSFCVAGEAAGVFLDVALERLGLNVRERCDMVTCWLPQLESSRFNVIYFVEVERYEQAARLTIVPTPDVTIRVFMAFRGAHAYDAELDTAKIEELRSPAREGFVAVEWGGMNLNGVSHD
ncbi:conserved unknown protein [Ectocarpus siliculosus]|uniref:Ubiquitin-like domain-containing protein n=1 Tax=Ectocarpus siliculosus TaxID=2880 RepID=D7G4B4_ECTSI|nr:conserved unknown protein [Ectocarpus siliculosus]|eukprot:CBJ27129.1 conserved unknown protein [Ectocarpus siliculosus]